MSEKQALPPFEQPRVKTVGFIVGTTENDVVLRMTLGDTEGTLHATRDQAEGELVQCWAEGFLDHEVFEIRAFWPRSR